MRSPVLLIPLLLVFALGLWWVLQPSAPVDEPLAEDIGLEGEADGGGETELLAGSPNARLATGPTTTRRPRIQGTHGRYQPRTGVMEVLPLGPDEVPISVGEVRVDLSFVGLEAHRTFLGHRDGDTGVWTFPKVPVGKVRFTVHGDYWKPTEAVVRVREGRNRRVEILVDRAGAIEYTAAWMDGSPIERLKVRLENEAGRAVAVYSQTKTGIIGRELLKSTERELGTAARLAGIPAGRYRLRLEGPDGETEVEPLTITERDTKRLTFELRRR
jgi:hypothetical protein